MQTVQRVPLIFISAGNGPNTLAEKGVFMEYYIKVNQEKVPVSEAVYKEWCRGERKERYFREGDISNGVFSYDALDTEEMSGSDLFTNPFQISTEAAAEREIMTEWLPRAIEGLSAEEKKLLLRLYVYEESLRQISSKERIPVTTLQYRHKKILKKLKNKFEHMFYITDK